MKKIKGRMELRYYDIPRDEFLIALQGESWKRRYGMDDGRLHLHNLMEIGICHDGEGVMVLEDECVPYKEGIITVIPANYPHDTRSGDMDNRWEYLFVDPEKILQSMYPEDVLFQQKLLDKINRKPFIGDEESAPELFGIVRGIFDEMEKKRDLLYKESVRGFALSLLIAVARVNGELSSMPEGIKARSGFEQVRPALDYIRENYSAPMKISEIASVCHVSESHFRRLFEENIGMTPVEYLNQVRIKKACDLIRKTGSSMEEIAIKVGFTTTSTFNRNFKRITGTSPYQWKKQPENFESRLAQFNIMVEKGW